MERIEAALLFGLHVDVGVRGAADAHRLIVQMCGKGRVECVDGGLRLWQHVVEMRDLGDGALGIVAQAVAGLHGIDQRIGRRGHRPGLLQSVVGAAQARHGSGKTVQLGAAGGEARRAADLDDDFGGGAAGWARE